MSRKKHTEHYAEHRCEAWETSRNDDDDDDATQYRVRCDCWDLKAGIIVCIHKWNNM